MRRPGGPGGGNDRLQREKDKRIREPIYKKPSDAAEAAVEQPFSSFPSSWVLSDTRALPFTHRSLPPPPYSYNVVCSWCILIRAKPLLRRDVVFAGRFEIDGDDVHSTD